jgi:hypothetical protein
MIIGKKIAAEDIKKPHVPRALREAAKITVLASDCYDTMHRHAAPANRFIPYTELWVHDTSGYKKNRCKKRKRGDDDMGAKEARLTAQDEA